MMWLYDLAIRLYAASIGLAALFNPKAKQWLAGRKRLLEHIEETCGTNCTAGTLWVHCASLGEFEMVRPVLERLRETRPEQRVILTFFSPSGYSVCKDHPLADHVFYLPLDTAARARRFIQAVRPSKVIFVRYELWHHHLQAAKQFGARSMLISAVFRPDQWFFRPYGAVGRSTLALFDHIFLVDKASEKLLHQIGIRQTTVCGDTRYDRVMNISAQTAPLHPIEQFKGSTKLIVCGSTWKEDEERLIPCINGHPEVKWVIAPHEVTESNLRRISELLPSAQKYSSSDFGNTNVLIVDSIGLLNRIYRYADVAYIGGGFRSGLHNILEATAYGTPAVFGPDTSRFPDAQILADQGLAFPVKNSAEMNLRFQQLLNEDQTLLRQRLLQFMNQRTGATDAIVKYTRAC